MLTPLDIGKFDLTDPALFVDQRFMDVFAALRVHAPIYFHEETNGPGFWVVSRHKDIKTVYTDAVTYGSKWGMQLGSRADAVAVVAGKMLTVSDPPQHTRVRRVVAAAFARQRLEHVRGLIETVVDRLMDEALEAGECDFVQNFARQLPTHAIAAMMGLPRSDWDLIGTLASVGLASKDEEVRLGANADIFMYFADLVDERRATRGEDLVSFLVTESENLEHPLTDEELIVNLSGILTGANETTRYVVAGSMLAFSENPEQLRLLQQDENLLPQAVEEILRWTTPGVHTLRTVTGDTELGGVRLSKGDRVTLWNCSANRDTEVFEDAEKFLIQRDVNPHMSFGFGRHLCVGGGLARMELHAFLQALRTKVEKIEMAGEVLWSDSNFTRGPVHVPVRLTRRRK